MIISLHNQVKHTLTGHLSCGTEVKCLINRRIGVKKWHYLISTDLALASRTIIARYLIRWEVENFYRAAKQILGWGDYQMRDLQAIENHVVLMMVPMPILKFNGRTPLLKLLCPKHILPSGTYNVNINVSRNGYHCSCFLACSARF